MKNQTRVFLKGTLSVFVFSLLLLTTESAFATVGGPTYIYDFKYNPADESVYYIVNSQSGRGCPPELAKISLNSGISEMALSCDEGEKILEREGIYDISPVFQKIYEMTQSFRGLTSINLLKNDISIDVDFVREERLSPEFDDIWWRSHFTASVYQNSVKIAEFPLTGCNSNQPFLFAGYAIPGFDKKIALLLSTKGDCFEGGYTYESLYVLGGLQNLDKTPSGSWKGNEPLVPSEATLIVFEKDEVKDVGSPAEGEKTEGNSDSESGFPLVLLAVVGLVSIAFGFLLGKIPFKTEVANNPKEGGQSGNFPESGRR